MEITTNDLVLLVNEAKKAPILGIYEGLNFDENLYLRYLWTLARKFKFKLMVEYGTWQGLSALQLAEGNPEGKVISIDNLCLASSLGIGNPLREKNKRDNITYLIQDCLTPNNFKDIDLLFMDGKHGPSIGAEYNFWLPKMASNGIILIDDIYWNAGRGVDEPDFWNSFNPTGGDKIDLSMLHTWSNMGFGAVVLKPFDSRED